MDMEPISSFSVIDEFIQSYNNTLDKFDEVNNIFDPVGQGEIFNNTTSNLDDPSIASSQHGHDVDVSSAYSNTRTEHNGKSVPRDNTGNSIDSSETTKPEPTLSRESSNSESASQYLNPPSSTVEPKQNIHEILPPKIGILDGSDDVGKFHDSTKKIDLETNLIGLLCDDNADGLMKTIQMMHSLLQQQQMADELRENTEVTAPAHITESMSYTIKSIFKFWFPRRLLHLACNLDSVSCAKTLIDQAQINAHNFAHDSCHGFLSISASVDIINAIDEQGRTALHHAAEKLSLKCIELLLSKHAKADLRSNDGYTPLQAALHNKRWEKVWQSLPPKDIIRTIKSQDLKAIQILANHTKDSLNLAFQLAMDGDPIVFTAFLLAAGKSLLSKENGYENFIVMIVEQLLPVVNSKENFGNELMGESTNKIASRDELQKKRSAILINLEITVLLKEEIEENKMPENRRKNAAPILRAAQAADEMIVKVLLNDVTCINATDSDGNTALHLCLRTNVTTKSLGIVWQLIRHGSSVISRNRLGFTPVHIAAGHGHIQALQLLLAQAPDTVHMAAETKETPLFLAVKNNHIECAKLLLQFGSNPKIMNLRKQRPIDLASSEDMRTVLSQNTKHTSGAVEATISTDFPINVGESQFECGAQVTDFRNMEEFLDDELFKMQKTHAKTVLCRYHKLSGGCARGDTCFYAHGEQELRPLVGNEKVKVALPDLTNKKIFVGGLPPAMGSDELKELFEDKFGPVSEAAVMGNHSGGRIQSRGFGFVTFKSQSPYLEAVRQHFITLHGKRVEIKAAMEFSSRTDEELLEMHLAHSSIKMVSAQGQDQVTEKRNTLNVTSNNASTKIRSNSPFWLSAFKKWFPAFLRGVLRRQESYPLSSVKADFRATCGLELDHVSVGYAKLSDFLHTMPDVCKMKIVPVGKGPATHVILQPCNLAPETSHMSRTLNSSLVHEGRTYATAVGTNPANISFKVEPSEIKVDCPYATAVGTNPGIISFKVEPSAVEVDCPYATAVGTNPANISFKVEPSATKVDCPGYIGSVNSNSTNSTTGQQSMPRSFPNDNTEDLFSSKLGKKMSSYINTDQNSIQEGNAQDLRRQIIHNNQQRLVQDLEKYSSISPMDRDGQRQYIPFLQTSHNDMESIGSWKQPQYRGNKITSNQNNPYLTPEKNITSLSSSHDLEYNMHNYAAHERLQMQYNLPDPFNVSEMASKLIPPSGLQGIVPSLNQHLHENSLRDQSQEYNQATGSFFEDYVCPYYNPWNTNTFQGCKRLIQEMNLVHNTPEESSDQSTLTSEGSIDSPPQSVLKPTILNRCVICCDETAIWTALPCAHRVMCFTCKDILQKKNQSLRHCLICIRAAQDWVMQY